MAKTKGSKDNGSRDKSKPSLDHYNILSPFDKLITYFYWLNIETNGTQGWPINKSGGRAHWRHYRPVEEAYTSHKFYNLAKVCSKLTLFELYIVSYNILDHSFVVLLYLYFV